MTPARSSERREQARVLLVGGHDLVAGAEIEPGDDGVDAVGGRARQRDVDGVTAERRRVPGARLSGELHQRLEVRAAAAAGLGLGLDPAADRLDCGGWDRPFGAGVEVGQPFEHGELGPEGL